MSASPKLDLVRSIYADWERGDFSSAEWADPEIDYVFADGPTPGTWTGLVGMAEVWRDWPSAWEDMNVEAEEYRELDDERVLALVHHGRGKIGGLDLGQVSRGAAAVFRMRGGKVTGVAFYWDREHALSVLGLAPDAGSLDSESLLRWCPKQARGRRRSGLSLGTIVRSEPSLW